MSESAIVTAAMSKRFGPVGAVKGLDWQVATGSLVGLVGPNGAGKTTLLKMLLGLTRPSYGEAKVLGYDIVTDSVRVRQGTAFVPEDKLIYDDMRVSAFLRLVGSYYPAWDGDMAGRMLTTWEIPQDRKVKALSKGMRAKVVLTAALSRNPRLLLLDEPTAGLDPGSVEQVLSLIAEWVAGEDRTVVVATHRLEEVERICDRVTLLDKGKELVSGDLDDLKSGWKSLVAYGVADASEVGGWPGVREVSISGEATTLTIDSDAPGIAARLREAGARGVELRDMNLREIFLRLTGEPSPAPATDREDRGVAP